MLEMPQQMLFEPLKCCAIFRRWTEYFFSYLPLLKHTART
jgi:hypothetical protein